jgi:glucose-1-phosphate adenylyltransferase
LPDWKSDVSDQMKAEGKYYLRWEFIFSIKKLLIDMSNPNTKILERNNSQTVGNKKFLSYNEGVLDGYW